MLTKFFDKRMLKYIDWLIIINIAVIAIFGIIAIANASSQPFTGDEVTITDYLDKMNWTYIGYQALWFGIGLIAMFFMMIPDYNAIGDYYKWIYWVNIVLLVLVLASSSIRGVSGWFKFGERAFQPSEIAKIAIIITTSKLFADKVAKSGKIDKVWDPDFWKIIAMFAFPFVLIVLQPDFGTAIVYVAIFFGILFASKTSWKVIGILVFATIVLFALSWLVMADWQKQRLFDFVSTENGYQVDNGQTAIGSGQMFGKGLFVPGSYAQLKYVPDSHTDFIFSVTIESVGFIGGTALIALYFLLLIRTLYLAMVAKDNFGTYLTVGVACMFIFHIFENIGMTIGLMPVTGIPLPFFSYGGSNMLTNMIAYGLVMNVAMRRTRWSIE